MTHLPLIALAESELPALKASMRDLQVAASAYYAHTAGAGSAEDQATSVRSFLSAAQVLNDLLTKSVADKAAYAALFKEAAPGTELISGVKYVRNVSQHVLHVVRPSKTFRIVGGNLGFRGYMDWDEVPDVVHDQLHKGTQNLRPNYRAHLEGREVMGTMLAGLRFFASLHPDIVHRDRRGEWTGFPLTSQPGMSPPLHPEEPADQTVAWEWLNARVPNGDCRVISAQTTVDGTVYVCGDTFIDRLTFTPFVETVDQVNRDITAGFPYFTATTHERVVDCTSEFPEARQSRVLRATHDVAMWATPVDVLESGADWGRDADTGEGRGLVLTEAREGVLGFSAYLIRRARRLNALVPPR